MYVISLTSRNLCDFFAQWYVWRTTGALRNGQVLHYVWQCSKPPTREILAQQAKDFVQTLDSTEAQHWFKQNIAILKTQWWGILAGWNRIALENEHLIFTVVVDTPLATLQVASGAFSDIVLHTDFFSEHTQKEADVPLVSQAAACLKRLCHWHTRLHYVNPANTAQLMQWNKVLQSSGWITAKQSLPPCAAAHTQTTAWQQRLYAPHWHTSKDTVSTHKTQQKAVIIGAGLSGAAVAYSLARRGWQVEILDTHNTPAAGASGLPVGLVVPHNSKDDTKISQISRAGVRCTLQRAQNLLQHGTDWAATGVVEHCTDGRMKLPTHWCDNPHKMAHDWSVVSDIRRKNQAMLPAHTTAIWHACAAWIQPAKLVAALLAQPNITFRGNQHVGQLQPVRKADTTIWCILDAQHHLLTQADIVVVAAAFGSQALLQSSNSNPTAHGIQLNPLRGQVAWQWHHANDNINLPPIPVNGKGSMAAHIPFEQDGKKGTIWISGSTFTRGDTDATPRDSDIPTLYDKLYTLHPSAAQQLQPYWIKNQLGAWAGVRATLPDRMPAVGSSDAQSDNGLYMCCGMGARGLALAMLCGEHLAEQLNHEPNTLPTNLARMLAASRWKNKVAVRH